MSTLSKSRAQAQDRRWRVGLVVVPLVAILAMTGLFTVRFDLWRSHPKLRWLIRPLILADPGIRRSTKVEIRTLLGQEAAT